MDLGLVLQTIEAACNDLQDVNKQASAEATLLAFQKSQRPIQACQYILEHSQNAIARFQAAATLREAALREWLLMSKEEKESLASYCLRYVLERAEGKHSFVEAKMLAVAAVLVKRSWLDEDGVQRREQLLKQVSQIVQGMMGVYAQKVGVAFLEALVGEFSLSTATLMGRPIEFHDRCAQSLEEHYLKDIFEMVQGAAVSSAARVLAEGMVVDIEVCAKSLHVMNQILCWKFLKRLAGGGGGPPARTRLSMRSAVDSMPVQPGRLWREVLLPGERIEWLLGLYATLRQKETAGKDLRAINEWMGSPLAVSARQVVVQLCSLKGDIFPNDGGRLQEEHLHRMLCSVISWLHPLESAVGQAVAGAEYELLDGCRALQALASVHASASFSRAFPQSDGHAGAINFLGSLTCQVIRAGMRNEESHDNWSSEAFELLLDTWVSLVQPAALHFQKAWQEPTPAAVAEAAASVFQEYVSGELGLAAASAHDEDDAQEHMRPATDARHEQLSLVAQLGRAAPARSLSFLVSAFSERLSCLQQCIVNRLDPTIPMEELYWMLLIAGHVLADSAKGETPMVPDSIREIGCVSKARGAPDVDNDLVVQLSRAGLELACLSLNPDARSMVFSPRLMEAILWFLARWSETYLMANGCSQRWEHVNGIGGANGADLTNDDSAAANGQGESLEGACVAVVAFGEKGEGKRVLEAVLRIASVALTAWPGERELQETACFMLLPALVRRRAVCRHLVGMEPWRELARAFVQSDPALATLGAPLQRSLASSLCRVVTGVEGAEACTGYINGLMGPFATQIRAIAARPDLGSMGQRPDVVQQVSCLLERLRGSARATLPQSQQALFSLGESVMDALLSLLQVYKNQPAIVYLILKYVVEWVDGQVAFINPQETGLVFGFSVRLLQVYSSHNIGKVSVDATKSLASESQFEKYKDLRALLQLLTSISSKDLLDFGSVPGVEPKGDVAQAVYLGLHIIVPLISPDLLKYPKLCRQYFTLLSHMLEIYPDKVVMLPPEAFLPIAQALNFGLTHQDSDVVNSTLAAIGSIAIFHYQERSRGLPGLGQHADAASYPSSSSSSSSSPSPHSAQGRGVLAHFLYAIMHLLLFEDYSNDLVEPAADVLLPLILCEYGTYQQLAQELLAGHLDNSLKARLSSALGSLMSGEVAKSLDRQARRQFRKSLRAFLADVRGLLRMK